MRSSTQTHHSAQRSRGLTEPAAFHQTLQAGDLPLRPKPPVVATSLMGYSRDFAEPKCLMSLDQPSTSLCPQTAPTLVERGRSSGGGSSFPSEPPSSTGIGALSSLYSIAPPRLEQRQWFGNIAVWPRRADAVAWSCRACVGGCWTACKR